MGDRKKEDDIAMALRNMNMSRTLKKSKEAERSLQLRLLDANDKERRDSQAAATVHAPGVPIDDGTVSNISSDNCEN